MRKIVSFFLAPLLVAIVGFLFDPAGLPFFGQSQTASVFDVITPEAGYPNDPKLMFRDALWNDIDVAQKEWDRNLALIQKPEQAIEYQQQQRKAFLEAIGSFPEKTPLRPRTVKTHRFQNFRLELVIIETQPNFFLTGALFLPDESKWAAPYPVMLITCGHSDEAKAFPNYQKVGILVAMNGIAAFVIDPIDQGERHQYLNDDGKPYVITTQGHNLSNPGSIAVGRSTAHYMIWDMIRSVDYLEKRDDIDANRIGIAGNSGGGTQASYLMALDPRIKVAAPSCYICSLYGQLIRSVGPQDAEQNIFGQLRFGMDHADYIMMHAPNPTLVCTATRDMFPIEDSREAYQNAKQFYKVFCESEKVSIIEADEEHGWSQLLREATVSWMVKWFYNRDIAVKEPDDLTVLPIEKLTCVDGKEVLKIDGARSVYDLNRELANQLATQREKIWANGLTDELREAIRKKIVARKLSELPPLKVEPKGDAVVFTVCGVECRLERFLAESESGVILPIVRVTPINQQHLNTSTKRPVLLLHGDGKAAAFAAKKDDAPVPGSAERFLQEGRTVFAADLRGLGETQLTGAAYYNHKHHGIDGTAFYLSYLLGKTCVGMRTEDLCMIADWLKQRSPEGIELYSYGLPGTVALHAAALEPTLFASVEIEASLVSWSNIVETGVCYHPNTDLVHGALTLYDIPNLVESLGTTVSFRNPVNTKGMPFVP